MAEDLLDGWVKTGVRRVSDLCPMVRSNQSTGVPDRLSLPQGQRDDDGYGKAVRCIPTHISRIDEGLYSVTTHFDRLPKYPLRGRNGGRHQIETVADDAGNTNRERRSDTREDIL